MARIGPVKLDVKVKGDQTTVDVRYDILFSQTDIKNKQAYEEVCRLIGDDTHAKDPDTAGPDDHLEFLTPLFNKPVKPGKSETLSRRVKKTFRAADLNEDTGSIPNADEIRALVVLRKVADKPGRPTRRESPMVKFNMG